MKKFLFALVLALPLLAGCKKEKKTEGNLGLTGAWYLEQMNTTTAYTYYEQYWFDGQGKFEYKRMVHSKANYSVGGYQVKQSGKYREGADDITLFDKTTYVNDYTKGDFSSEDKLIKITDEDVVVKRKINGNLLTLDFPCPINANCTGPLTYHRSLPDILIY